LNHIDKTLHFTVQSIEGLFSHVKGYLDRKVGATIELGMVSELTAALFNFLFGRHAGWEGILRRFSDRPLLHAFFCDALCFDVIVSGVLRVPREVIVIHFGSKGLMIVKNVA
jgi:hypothetical protein